MFGRAVVVALIVLCMAKRHKVINTISQFGEDIRLMGGVEGGGDSRGGPGRLAATSAKGKALIRIIAGN